MPSGLSTSCRGLVTLASNFVRPVTTSFAGAFIRRGRHPLGHRCQLMNPEGGSVRRGGGAPWVGRCVCGIEDSRSRVVNGGVGAVELRTEERISLIELSRVHR